MSEVRRNKAKSVAAFLFLPQFSLSMQSMSHILPVLVRTIAVMFAQAGLIARNHPATRYGNDGVRTYRFRDLMGDGWYTLRHSRSTPYQWSLYFAIVMMISVGVCSLGTAIVSTAFNAATVAQAQVFTHPGNPYGGDPTAHNTGFDQVEALGSGAGTIFDTRFAEAADSTGASTDYALMVLDKVLRQGAEDVGGSSQKALRPLMQVYNTGVLVVASVMLFWIIISIVVDTAKTGQIGGGRHNMVWAPIRIVFALGLMIPLGANGFSSGQYMVMKLAEWGSNFGSYAWSQYINSVTSVSSIIPGFSPSNVSGLAEGIAKIKTCQVVFNAQANESSSPDADEMIRIDKSNGIVGAMTGKTSVAYTNSSSGVKCGTIWWSEGGLGDDFMAGADAALTGIPILGAPQLGSYMVTFRAAMQHTINELLDETEGPDSIGSQVYLPAARYACTFAGMKVFSSGDGADQTNNPVLKTGPGQLCPSSSFDDTYGFKPGMTASNLTDAGLLCTGGNSSPGTSCHEAITTAIINNLNNAFCGNTDCTANVETDGTAYSSNAGNSYGVNVLNGMQQWFSNSLTEDNTARGWAGMGMWYQTITVMVKAANAMEELDAGFIPGTLWTEADDSGIEKKTFDAMKLYDDWWKSATTLKYTRDPATGELELDANQSNLSGESADRNKELRAGKGWLSSFNPFADRDHEWFMVDVLDGTNENVYPMAALADTGDSIIAMGFAMVGGSWLVEDDEQPSAMNKFVSTVGWVLVVCGIMISYYLPVLPFVRVAFAVVTWIISVFEAVCMVPIAALAHLTSEGEGLAGGAKQAWILWLNILLRPVLVVLGFVGAMLVFNAFITYFQPAFATIAITMSTASSIIGTTISKIAYSIIFVAVMYMAANLIFKMLDTIPNGLIRWMGGSQDHSFDSDGGASDMMLAGTNLLTRVNTNAGGGGGGGNSNTGIQNQNPPGGNPPPGGTPPAGGPGGGGGGGLGGGGGGMAPATGGGSAIGGGAAGGAGAGAGAAGGAAGGAGAAAAASDRRLKEGIVPMGQENGHNIYAFRYIGQPETYIGVMADEVLKTHPEAVVVAQNGYHAVYYDKIGVKFRLLH